jgi:DNA polymerase-1
LPDEGEILLVRDFSAQEIRVAAHFAEGTLLDAYNANPEMDVHLLVQKLIQNAIGHEIPRRISKTITFLKLYGGGPKKLIDQIGCTMNEARAFFAAYDDALPEFARLNEDIEKMVKRGIKIRTWGGRLYDVEPPAVMPTGKVMEKYYKLPNTLIQGSSADMSKHAIIRYHTHPSRKGRLLLQVHDELVVSVKEEHKDSEMALLKWAMNEMPGWDVPIRSSGAFGYDYGNLTDEV